MLNIEGRTSLIKKVTKPGSDSLDVHVGHLSRLREDR